MVYAVPREDTEIVTPRAKISVIVPCYNAQNYLDRCVNSIVSQTYGIENLEVLLINDASTDGTGDMLEGYEKQHPDQMLVIHCEQNGKQGTARNIGLQYASGEYVTFVDADDAIASNMLMELAKGMGKWQVEVAECAQMEVQEGHEIRQDAEEDKAKLFLIETEEERKAFFLSNAWACGPVRRLYRKSFLEQNRLRFLEKMFMEDMYFTYLVLAKCRSWYQISDPLYYYYQNPDSVMHSSAKKEYYMDVHRVFQFTADDLKERNIFPVIREEMEFVYFRKVFYDLSSYILHTFNDPLQHGIGEMKEYIRKQFPNMRMNCYMDENQRKEYDLLMHLGE